jgi:hypothetical protein
MFQRFPSLTRFSHDWTITEKLDGTNAAVYILPHYEWPNPRDGIGGPFPVLPENAVAEITIDRIIYAVFAQSRSKLITPGKSTDNHGFARFVQDNAEALVATLGEGRHFGEWVGKGINKRNYGISVKVFALFNTHRWNGLNELNGQLRCVPVLFQGYSDDPGQRALECMQEMQATGSAFAPGFMNPEGVVMYHGPSKTTFKKTYDYDEAGKWAENQGAKA